MRGYESLIFDDHFHLSKLTSIAATGLPSLYARQPLYAFTYYDLDYIVPAFWVRYSSGAIGIAQAWVVHIGIQTFVITLFLTRLLYSAEDEKVHQQDTILWNQFTGNTSSRGHPELFSSLILFDYENAAQFLQYNQTIPMDFPDELPAGEYELRLTVYNAITLQETVELGTWKPEIVLSRLRYAPDNFE